MPISLRFTKARMSALALARVGNPLRDEPLLTSRSLCRLDEAETALLTKCFLKPFRALDAHRLHHHSGDPGRNEVFARATAAFDAPEALLEHATAIAELLYARSKHPNIKPGDLCVALIDGIAAGGAATRALAIIKAETTSAFLQFAVEGDELRLRAEEGISPDKIDKGALIVDHDRDSGCLVQMFDKSGGKAHFWNRDFLGAAPRDDAETHTRDYAKLCVAFAENGLPEATPSDERMAIAHRALDYLSEADTFDPDAFNQAALREPAVREHFADFKSRYEEERGEPVRDRFDVDKPVADKARRAMKGKMKFDTGAAVYFNGNFLRQSNDYFQQGFDEKRNMRFVKIFYNDEVD